MFGLLVKRRKKNERKERRTCVVSKAHSKSDKVTMTKQQQKKGITYFDENIFQDFFNYSMKCYLEPQNSVDFKNQLIEIYKIM